MKNNLTKKTGVILIGIIIHILLISISICMATAEAESLLSNADKKRKDLYASSKKMKYRHNWENCIKLYNKIYQSYPNSDEAAWALYHSAGLYSALYRFSGRESDIETAVSNYKKLTEEYAGHRLADDAQYKIGEIYYSVKNDPTQAYVEFLKVDIKFPSGDMRPKARTMMDKLAAMLGKKEQPETEGKETSTSNELTEVKNIRHWSTPTYTRVVIDLDKSVKYTAHLLKKDPDLNKPRRLYLDLDGTYIGSQIDSAIPIKDGLLLMARAGQYDKDTVRVVLDINNIGGYKTFHLFDPFRIVVDVKGEENTVVNPTVSKQDTRRVEKGIKKVKEPDSSVSLARQLGLSVRRIVIDPGHGGKDPGTYFKGGIREKNIVLSLAKKLVNNIENELGCEVLLTRDKDIFLPLDERTAFANVKKADLFISLHINAHKQSSIFGVETYFLNMATDKRAVLVAARENATSEKNISDLQSILNDLMLNTKISESSKLAYEVQKGMMGGIQMKYKTFKDLGVKQAPFYVLIGAEMPAILVETGFITNSTERQRLLTESYQEILADGIVTGIRNYINSIGQVYTGGGG